jgi:hypothetical protein
MMTFQTHVLVAGLVLVGFSLVVLIVAVIDRVVSG